MTQGYELWPPTLSLWSQPYLDVNDNAYGENENSSVVKSGSSNGAHCCPSGYHEHTAPESVVEGPIPIWSTSGGLRNMCAGASSFVVGAAAALDVGNYRGSWSFVWWCPDGPKSLASTFPGSNYVDSCTGPIIIFPILFTAATSTIYQLNKHRHYQDHFLFAGITLGIGVGLSTDTGLQSTIFKLMPWTILVSLLCSVCYSALRARDSIVVLDEKDVL